MRGLLADGLKNGKLFLRQAKTKHSVWVLLPSKVVKALTACDEVENGYYSCAWYWEGEKVKTAIPSGRIGYRR